MWTSQHFQIICPWRKFHLQAQLVVSLNIYSLTGVSLLWNLNLCISGNVAPFGWMWLNGPIYNFLDHFNPKLIHVEERRLFEDSPFCLALELCQEDAWRIPLLCPHLGYFSCNWYSFCGPWTHGGLTLIWRSVSGSHLNECDKGTCGGFHRLHWGLKMFKEIF